MSWALKYTKNFIRQISPFHSNSSITHASLRKEYLLAKSLLQVQTKEHYMGLLADLKLRAGHDIDHQRGFLITKSNDISRLEAVTDYCRQAWPKKYIEKTVSKPSKNDTLLSVHLDLQDPRNKIVKDFILSAEIIATAARYLEEIPILFGAYVWYCPNRAAEDMVGSQMYHCDREDYRQLKVFIPIDEITPNCGPTTCVDANATKLFFTHLSRQGSTTSLKNRFTDDEVHTYASTDEQAIVGKPGTLGFVDTTNCLHYGSRPAKRGKYHIVLHFVTPFSSKLRDKIKFNELNGALEDIVFCYRSESKHIRSPIN